MIFIEQYFHRYSSFNVSTNRQNVNVDSHEKPFVLKDDSTFILNK